FGTVSNDHGWGNINSVLWNLTITGPANEVVVQEPPLGQNYAFGVMGGSVVKSDSGGSYAYGRGVPLGDYRSVVLGHVEGTGRAGLAPHSLYRAQLTDRLGIGAVPIPPSELNCDSSP